MRVAVISMHTSPTATLGRSANGGLNVYVREVCAALGRRGVATDVFTRNPSGSSVEIESILPRSRVVYLPAGPPELDREQLLREVPGFAERALGFVNGPGPRYDLLYSHYWLSGMAACGLRQRTLLPWVHIAHTLAVMKNSHLPPGDRPEPEVRVELEGEISHCADLLVVSTAAEGDALRRAYGIRPDRLSVIAPGIDLAAFQPLPPAEARRRLGREGQRFFVFVGRLERLKGVDILLRAMALITAGGRRPDVRLLVLGEDSHSGGESEQGRLRSLSTELGLEVRVEFLGSVPQDQLPTYYGGAEACLMPSYSESFGLVGLEAQACGTALVGSKVDGLASWVREGVTGYLVDGPHPDLYADRMARLLDEPGLAARLGEAGHRLARRYTWESTADRLLDCFHRLARHRRSERLGAGLVEPSSHLPQIGGLL
jgi:D-inositol-3-phosphate glycosyltransferase